MFIKCTCYLNGNDITSIERQKKFIDSGRDLSVVEYNTMLNTDHIASLEEKNLYDKDLLKFRTPMVIATMSNGKEFFIKAKSISELQLRTAIEGKEEL